MEKKVIAIDIEGRGPSAIRNGIVSIGIALHNQKIRINVKPYPDQVMDEKCYSEFWKPLGTLHEELQKDAIEPSLAMGALRLILDNAEDAYIVCDTPAYDFYFINYYLDREGLPLLRIV